MIMLCPNCWGHKSELDGSGNTCAVCNGTGVIADQQLSDHFHLSEFLYSETAVRKGIPNNPTPTIVLGLIEVARDLLEPIRAKFGAIHINSGYRSPALNAALSGSSKTSVHPLGHAADIKAVADDVTRKMIVDFVIEADLPYDQIIFEGTWVHAGRRAPDEVSVRKEKIMMFPSPGGAPVYSPYDPNDPRVGAL